MSIPEHIKREMRVDSFMERCCIPGCKHPAPVQWHHNLIFGGRQVQERFCILPICFPHHEVANNPEVRRELDYIMFKRANENDLIKYRSYFRALLRRKRNEEEESYNNLS